MRWRVEFPGMIYEHNEEFVVYFDAQTGDTHLVSAFAGHIIRLLFNHPLDLDEIVEQLSTDIAEEDAPELTKAIPEILADLLALNITTNA